MKSMKKKIIALAALALALFITFTAIPYGEVEVSALDTSVEAEEALRDEISSLQDEQKELKQKLENAKANEEEQKIQKEYLDSLIFSTHNEIDATTKLIEEYEVKIEEKTAEIAALEADMDQQYEEVTERLRFTYQWGDIGYLEMLLDAKSFVDFLVTADRVSSLLEYDRSLMENIQNSLETLKTEKTELEKIQRDNETLKAELEQTEKDLEQQIKDTENYIVQLQEDQVALEEDYQKAKALEKEADAKIEEILKNRIPEPVVPDSSGQGPVYDGTFIFPVDRSGFSYVSSEYGSRTLWGYDDFHLGIDLAARYGTNVYASAAGTVVVSGYHYSYGYYIVIDHGNGYATTYAHNSQLLVSENTYVSQGQLIAKVGSTGSSSGNHLHFEVRINGSTTNPRGYINP